MSIFLTGATGLIGRHLVEVLLRDTDAPLFLLVRESTLPKLDAFIERWGSDARSRIHPVVGDLDAPSLGIDKAWVKEHQGKIDHFFHLAALYDLGASAADNARANVYGTRHAVDAAGDLQAGCFHHVSSIAIAGRYDGVFREDMFDEGQELPTAYHRTKFESERIVREENDVPWRVYRPSVVVGNSWTGQMDKIDGPYYLFPLMRGLRSVVPPFVPIVAPDVGDTNIVPVDYVAEALAHLSHLPDLDGRAFHLTHPAPQRVVDVWNAFASAAGAPQITVALDRRLTSIVPTELTDIAFRGNALKPLRKLATEPLGIPDDVIGELALVPVFDATDARRLLAAASIDPPEIEDYAGRLWEYWDQRMDPVRPHVGRKARAALRGKTVLVTGASSGIGKATALKVAAAGGIPLLVSRTRDKLEEVQKEIEEQGGTAHVFPCDLSDLEAIDQLVEDVTRDHEVDVLVNNAGRSIRRSVSLSYDRFHDYERTMHLNYFAPVRLTLGLLPHMVAQGGGNVVNVTTIGVTTLVPRFSAYIASKSALDAFSQVINSEMVSNKVVVTSIRMPLVRTPMITPTKAYDYFPAISPEDAADLIIEGVVGKHRTINTGVGSLSQVIHATAPRFADRVKHIGYRVFPDSLAAIGASGADDKMGSQGTIEQRVVAALLRGIHL
ncbi:MAG: SDR family oxidoreductase [Patulibacter sp.]|nr:SDR family oxidoreductase [Patulibacter sp.]